MGFNEDVQNVGVLFTLDARNSMPAINFPLQQLHLLLVLHQQLEGWLRNRSII